MPAFCAGNTSRWQNREYTPAEISPVTCSSSFKAGSHVGELRVRRRHKLLSWREIRPHREDALRPPFVTPEPVIDPSPGGAVAAAAAPTPSFRGFTGLTSPPQRTARNGNQFSAEPPDQGLAVGNGFVLEAINSALNVYDTNGVQLLPRPLALSEFFAYRRELTAPPVFLAFSLGDVSCLFDPETQRWFVVALAQFNTPTGVFIQQSRLYLAVSETSDPTALFRLHPQYYSCARSRPGRAACP